MENASLLGLFSAYFSAMFYLSCDTDNGSELIWY